MANNIGMSPEARDNIQVLAQRVGTTESSIQEMRSNFSQLNDKMDSQARNSGEKIDTLFRSLDQRLSTQIESISRELGKQVEAVNEKVNTGRVPNYAVLLGFITVCITVFGTVYAFVSTPINQKLMDLQTVILSERAERNDQLQEIRTNLVPRAEQEEKSRVIERDVDSVRNDIDALDARFVTRQEVEASRTRAAEDRAQWDDTIKDLRTNMTTRAEWSERNGSRDHEIQNLMTAMSTMRADIQRQLDTQANATASLSNSLGNGRDTIQGMRDQIEKLQEYLLRFVGRNNGGRLPLPTQ